MQRRGEKRNPWSRRLEERRKVNMEIEEDLRKGEERRKIDQRSSFTEKRGNR
jgi:hypothetical protein